MKPRVIYEHGRTGVGRCRWCKADIVWALTDNERRMPVDVKGVPVGAGNLILHVKDGQYHVTHVDNVPAGELERTPHRWVCHWATCPKSKEIRARVEAKRPQPEQLDLLPRGRS